jgi:peptidoglycan/LPS O-acetylase OafA/YrhL
MNATMAIHPSSERNLALGYLRAFVTVLVVAHHAVLAYHPYAPTPGSFVSPPFLWSAFPIVDTQRWAGIDLFVAFNDAFFMALMFLLSGLFVWPSLQRRGVGDFLRERVLRLGVPFVVAALILAPLSYYPAYLQSGAEPGFKAYAAAWTSLGVWPAGPAWFLWVLLAFGIVAAVVYRIAPRCAETLGAWIAPRSLIVFFSALVAITALAYVPLALAFNPLSWASVGPFFVQSGRVLLYFSYFAIGVALGAWGVERGVFAEKSKLARRWFWWMPVAIVIFFALIALFVTLITSVSNNQPALGLEVATNIAFVMSCAASSLAFVALFIRFAQKRSWAFDSLSSNAYGIYLFHYVFVVSLQFVLLDASWSASAKGATVFLGALLLSWGTSASLRRISAIARVI